MNINLEIKDVSITKIESLFDDTVVDCGTPKDDNWNTTNQTFCNLMTITTSDHVMTSVVASNWFDGAGESRQSHYYEHNVLGFDTEVILRYTPTLVSVIRLVTETKTDVATAHIWYNGDGIFDDLDALGVQVDNIAGPKNALQELEQFYERMAFNTQFNLTKRDNTMTNIASSIGIYYGNQAALLAEAVKQYINVNHKVALHITDIGSGDVTAVDYNGETFETQYAYCYENEQMVSLILTCNDIPLLKEGLVVKANSNMKQLYDEIMLSTHLINECTKASLLSDEAKAHSINWQDAI